MTTGMLGATPKTIPCLFQHALSQTFKKASKVLSRPLRTIAPGAYPVLITSGGRSAPGQNFGGFARWK